MKPGGRNHRMCDLAMRYLRPYTFMLALHISAIIPSFANAFVVNTLGDYGNVTVMEVEGGYDSKLPDGSLNLSPRHALAREFYRTHPDEYDFLVVFTGFNIQMPDDHADAYYMHVKNDTLGIGKGLFDHTGQFGSNGRLQGYLDMSNLGDITGIFSEHEQHFPII